ncbi:hypothetical protein RB614_21280 [Phytohabitans sp. ZYX-F-186]|uniref:Lipocalin-like domain-containing protein n=1 Tax=Phytohabitans maris TaxID=3071409 RepID=A0ABU0ZJ31_9ACTN|nr:hypothetical protein [Phytohabitans sp. ZYX-F-186]MDQ7907048.1 hypothetical protein [Phytohabitans sp. ZYX-F-186]
MQPCAVCGGVQVDAAGYCTRCGTFRGVPHQPPPPSYPQAPPPAYPGYPQPGSPPAYPTSVPPAGYPTSVPPAFAQQTSGGGYPGYPPQQQPQRGRSYLVPLVALGCTLLVLVVAIVIVVAARGGGEDPIAGPTSGAPTSAGPQESSSATPASDIDQCVIGTWRVTSHRETVSVQGQGSITFTGGEGATLRLRQDGTGETDYGSGTEYRGDFNGETAVLEISGRLTFDYKTGNGRVSVSEVESTAKAKFRLGSEEYDIPQPLDTNDNSASYTCSTGALTQNTALLTTEYERIS